MDNWISNLTISTPNEYTDSKGTVYVVDPIITFPEGYPYNIMDHEPCVVQAEEN